MTKFEEMASKEVVCDICCRTMYPLPGNGWDNDRIICEDRECGAEIVFPTSTEVHNTESEGFGSLLAASVALKEYLESPACAVEGFDIPDAIWMPFADTVEAEDEKASTWRISSHSKDGQKREDDE